MTNEERNLLSSDPYPGLRPYHEDEQDKFFGRNADAEVLIDKVLTNRLTLLFAASGVGKSSLLQAAVIPRLKSPTGENLEVVYHIDWVSEPVSSVRAAVLQALHSSGKLPEGAADEAGETLAELLEFCGLFVRHPLVLILDQFEEFFRYQRASANFQPFIEQLTAIITNPQLPVSLVLSMREDFALELNAFKPRLPTILFENFYRLEKLGRVGAREAIVTPVEQVGFRYEPVLLEILLDDLLSRELDRLPNSPAAELLETVEPPYLQIVCAQLWDLNRADPDKLLRLVTYEKAGKAKGILSNYLKGVLQGFSLTEKQLASKAFDHLASQRGVKMAYTAAALAETVRESEAALSKVLDKLAAVRILRTQQRGEATWYELYHDMFSGSIESWNGEWKDRMRRRKFAQVAAASFVSIAALFAGWDYYVNTTNYQLRISVKQGISDQVELWQGKPGSFDLFHQQHYLAETDFKRHQLEPDKQFSQKSVADYSGLQTELTSSLPIDQRITAYAENGKYQDAMQLANKSIIPENPELAVRALPHLVAMKVSGAAFLFNNMLQYSSSAIIKEKISKKRYYFDIAAKDFSNLMEVGLGRDDITPSMDLDSLGFGIILASSNPYIDFGSSENYNTFWEYQLYIQIATQFAYNNILHLKDGAVVIPSKTPDAEKVIPYLINKLAGKNLAAIEAVAQLQVRDAIPVLIKLLNNKNIDEDTRSTLVTALGQLQAKSAIPVLLDILKDNSIPGTTRSAAATALGQLKVKDAIPVLLGFLENNTAHLDSGKILTALVQLQAKKTIPSLLKLLENNDADESTRSEIVNALVQMQAKDTIPSLLELLKNKNKNKNSNENVRSAIANALAQMQAKDAIPSLLELLENKSTDENARKAVANALAQMQAKDAIPSLLELLENKNTEKSTIGIVVSTLGKLQAKNATPIILELLRNKSIDEGVRSEVVATLGELQAMDAIPALQEMLENKSTDENTRGSVATALGKLQARNAIPSLLRLLEDKNTGVSTRCNSAVALGGLKARNAMLALLELIKNESTMASCATDALRKLRAKESIPALLGLFRNFDSSNGATIALTNFGFHHLMPNIFSSISNKRDYLFSGLPNLESSGYVASGELLDFLLRSLKNGDPDIRRSAIIAALRMDRGRNLNEIQKRLLDKALSLIDLQSRDAITNQLAEEDKQEAKEKKLTVDSPVNQPGLEEKPLTLDELKTKLDEFDQAYADWRERRDAEPAANTANDAPATDNETDKLADPAPFIYEYSYAIANMDEAEGIKLLGHNLAKVREAAARGLANSDFLGVPLLQKLEQEWLATDNPITRQGLFHAIDIALLAMEGIGADKELEALKTYEPTLTNERSAASIKPRVEWTRIQLQWRVDALKELKELADRQLPGLLKEYCLNPDGTDIEGCTIER